MPTGSTLMGCIEFTEHDLALPEESVAKRSGADALAVEVARMHGLRVGDMLGPSRNPALTRARADLYRRLRACGWSYPMIGRFCGGRDHTTVMSALGALKRGLLHGRGVPTCWNCRMTEGAHERKPMWRGVYSPLLCAVGGKTWAPGGPPVRGPRIAEALEEARRANALAASSPYERRRAAAGEVAEEERSGAEPGGAGPARRGQDPP